MAIAVAAIAIRSLIVPPLIVLAGCWWAVAGAAFDDFVEFAALKPDAAACLAIVDFHA